MERREYIAAIGSTTGALFAGCLGDGTGSDPAPTTDAPATRATEAATTEPSPEEDLVSINRDETATHTFGGVLEMRNFGWTDRELHYGTPGATGVIENVGQERLRQASLAVDFYDEDTQIGTNTNWFDFLEPGEYGALDIPYEGGEPARITRIVVSASVQTEPITPLNDGQVAVTDNGLGENEHGWPAVGGTVENDTDERIDRVLIHVNFYRDRELLGHGRDAVPRLGSQEHAEWSTTTDRPDAEEVNRYTVITTVQK